MPAPDPIPEPVRQRAIEMRRAGAQYTEITAEVSISAPRLYALFRDAGIVKPKPKKTEPRPRAPSKPAEPKARAPRYAFVEQEAYPEGWSKTLDRRLFETGGRYAALTEFARRRGKTLAAVQARWHKIARLVQ